MDIDRRRSVRETLQESEEKRESLHQLDSIELLFTRHYYDTLNEYLTEIMFRTNLIGIFVTNSNNVYIFVVFDLEALKFVERAPMYGYSPYPCPIFESRNSLSVKLKFNHLEVPQYGTRLS